MHIVKEKEITQNARQLVFDNYQATDDHGMHIFGIAKDQNGAKYFIFKNSWGAESNEDKGTGYISMSYFKQNTISIVVHKNAIPKAILTKLKIQ